MTVAWADVAEVIDTVVLTMERVQPTPEQLASYLPLSTPTEYAAAAQRTRDAEQDARVISFAMNSFPARCVCAVIW
jgi:hypothetical protein